jgi:carboxymethylenebutenolidase
VVTARTPISAPVADGTAQGNLLGTGPLVVFHPDAGGVRPAMFEMAQHLVDAGYAVLVVDLYWRLAPFAPFDARTVFDDPPERARLMGMARTVDSDQVASDTAALLDTIGADRVGMIGYCLGGKNAYVAAARLGERVAALATFHAGGLVLDGPESPHRMSPDLAAEVYVGIADGDASCSPEHQVQLEEALTAAGVTHELEVYDGARHGFAVPDFAVYDEAAAAKHWDRALALFARTLPTG